MSIEESAENFDQMKDFLLELAKQYRRGIGKMDGTETRENEKNFIEFILKKVKDEILPEYPANRLEIYSDGRAKRSFDHELKRLWARAITAYQEHSMERLPELAKEIMEDDPEENRKRYQAVVEWQVNNITISLLEEHIAPGDDLLLYLIHTFLHSDDNKTIDLMAENLETPAQLFASFLGMFGLLMQARKSAEAGNQVEAYTYLVDASFMLGAYESAAYITPRLERIAKSRRGKENARKKHDNDIKSAEQRKVVLKLFGDLKPSGKDGNQRTWKSSGEAVNAISDYLNKHGMIVEIPDSTLVTLCAKLLKNEKENRKRNKYGIIMQLAHTKKDGTVTNIDMKL